MKIENHSSNAPPIDNENQPGTTNAKNLNDLKPGDRFRAVVTDITPSNVSLKLASGQTITAKSMILPEARIGEESIFAVKENFKGQILLEMLKPDRAAPIAGIVREALRGADMVATLENIELVTELIKNSVPPDKETLHRAAFFKYSNIGIEFDKLLFLLKEGFEAGRSNLDILERLLDIKNGLDTSLTEIAAEIMKIEPQSLKKEMILDLLGASQSLFSPEDSALISGGGTPDGTSGHELMSKLERDSIQYSGKNFEVIKLMEHLISLTPKKAVREITERLFLDINAKTDEGKNIIGEYFKGLSRAISSLLERLDQIERKGHAGNLEDLGSTHADSKHIMTRERLESELGNNVGQLRAAQIQTDQLSVLKAKLETAAESLRFMDQINTQKEYMQIPFHLNGQVGKTDLYVYKDPPRGGKSREGISALIALDLSVLGHVECLINKSGKNVGLNFKLRNDDITELVKNNSHRLINSLNSKGYKVSDTTFVKAEKETKLTDAPDGIADDKPAIRYAFDMRV